MKTPLIHIASAPEALVSPDVLGGKGYNLVRLATVAGLRVPPAVVLPCTEHQYLLAHPDTLMDYPAVAEDALQQLKSPLGLFSVRSGAKYSMPGMMDTILNVGILEPSRAAAIVQRGGAEFALDCALRFTEMYLDVVHGYSKPELATVKLGCQQYIDAAKAKYKTPQRQATFALECIAMMVAQQAELDMTDTKAVVARCMAAVHCSWLNDRAVLYRNKNNIPHDIGTAVIVQQMVFGNLNDDSCTGVMFSSNPATGAPELVGEFLRRAQGEDVVAGTHTPQPLMALNDTDPGLFEELMNGADHLESLFGDMQDMEFTVEDGVLYWLQTRNAKRTQRANVVFNVNQLCWSNITLDQFRERVSYSDFISLLEDKLVSPPAPDFQGIGASAGVVRGIVVHDMDDVTKARHFQDDPYLIFVAEETTPDDLAMMYEVDGILTRKGGLTSHAAVVARGMGRVCVVGCDLPPLTPLSEITIEGSTGNVWLKGLEIEHGNQRELLELVSQLNNKIHTVHAGVTSAAVYLGQDHLLWAAEMELAAKTRKADWLFPVLPLGSQVPDILVQAGVLERQPKLLWESLWVLDEMLTKPLHVVLPRQTDSFRLGMLCNFKHVVVSSSVTPANLTVSELANHMAMRKGAPLVTKAGGGAVIPVRRSILNLMQQLGLEYRHEHAVDIFTAEIPDQVPGGPVLHMSAPMLLRALWP